MPLYKPAVDPGGLPASDAGMKAWAYDSAAAINGSLTAAGVVHLVLIRLWIPATITGVALGVTTGGGTLATSFAGLYDTAGTRVGVSADQSTPWQSSGSKTAAFTGAYAASPGLYRAAILTNGTTQPTFCRSLNAAMANINVSGSSTRFATFGTGLTALPASIDMSTITASAVGWWAALY